MPKLLVERQFTFTDDKGKETPYKPGIHTLTTDEAAAMYETKDGKKSLHWFVAEYARIVSDDYEADADPDLSRAKHVAELEASLKTSTKERDDAVKALDDAKADHEAEMTKAAEDHKAAIDALTKERDDAVKAAPKPK